MPLSEIYLHTIDKPIFPMEMGKSIRYSHEKKITYGTACSPKSCFAGQPRKMKNALAIAPNCIGETSGIFHDLDSIKQGYLILSISVTLRFI